MATKEASLKDKPEVIKKITDYHSFQERDSWLDLLIDQTKINQTEFKGFFTMFMVLFIFYVFTLPFYNYVTYGYFLKFKIIERMINDLSILLLIWPLFHFWTYSAYLLELLILKNFPKILIFFYKCLTQYSILLFTWYVCIYRNMCTTHIIFTMVQGLIHFFKMHSYTNTNRDYREHWLKKKHNIDYKPISSYPNNITFSNFFYFLRAPTFVYQEQYPRSGKFRLNYFILKVLKAFFCLILTYYIYTEHIETTLPIMLTSSFFELFVKLYFPVILWCLVSFFLLFECVLPGYAELATFGDRQFYDDWWNSTDLEEFNRKWNKIVHEFLYRHVYLECRNRHKLNRLNSQIITFIISAIFHEYCLCMMIKLFRPVMFMLMMIQIPLIYLGRKYMSGTRLGNYFVWFSLIVGNPLIFILYNREYIHFYDHY